MKQRLGLTVALLNNPKILILDEPTNGLDPIGIKALEEINKTSSLEEVFIKSAGEVNILTKL